MVKKIQYNDFKKSLQDPRSKVKDPSTTKTKVINYEDFVKDLKIKPSYGSSKYQRFVGDTGIGESKYDYNVTPTEIETLGLDYIRASQQPWTEQAGRAIGGGLYKGALTAIEDVGYLLDLENNIKRLAGLEDVDTNFVSSWAKEMKESYDEKYPIYKYNPDKVMDFSDPGFYWSALQGVIDSAVGFGAIGVGAGATVGKGLKYLAAANKFGAPVQNLMATAGTAFTTNYAEGKMMAVEMFDNVVKDRMGEVEKELFNQAFKEVNNLYPTLDPNVKSQEALRLLNTDKYQQQLQQAEEQIRTEAGEQADAFQRRNMIFMLSDAVAINGMFRGKGVTRNLLKDKSFKNTISMIGKQAPTEYVEEVGQGVLQKEGEYQALKAAGHDVSDISSDPVQRTFDFFVDPQTQLEGLMGLFGGPVQHVLVQAPSNLAGRKSDQEYREAQKEQVKQNEQLLNALIVDRANTEKAKQDAILKGDDQGFNTISKEDFANIFYSNAQRGTVENLENLVKEVSQLSPEEAAEKGYGENYKEEAQKRLEDIKALEKTYLKTMSRFSGDDQQSVRKYAYDLTVKQRAISEGLTEISKERNELLRDVQEEIKTLENKNITDDQFELEELNDRIQIYGQAKSRLTSMKNEALLKPNKRLERAANELKKKIDKLQEVKANKHNYTQQEIDNYSNEVVTAREKFNRLSIFAGQQTRNKKTIDKVNRLYNERIDELEQESNELKQYREELKSKIKENKDKIRSFNKKDYSSWKDLQDITEKQESYRQAGKMINSEYQKLNSNPDEYVAEQEEKIKNSRKDSKQRDVDNARTPEEKEDIINKTDDPEVKQDLEKDNKSKIQKERREQRKNSVQQTPPVETRTQDPFTTKAGRIGQANTQAELNKINDDIDKDKNLTEAQKNQLKSLINAKKKIAEEIENDETTNKPTAPILDESFVSEVEDGVDNTEEHVRKENGEISTHDNEGPVYENKRVKYGFNLVAHLHRLYKRVVNGKKISKQDVDNELNPNIIHTSVLNPNKYGKGTKVYIKVDDSKDTIVNAETGETWADYLDSIKNLPEEEKNNLIRDIQPMVIVDEDDNVIGHLHTTEWINDENIYTDVNEAKENIRKIRDKIIELDNNNDVYETTIENKSIGYLFRNTEGLQKVSKAIEDENVIYAIGGRGTLISDQNLENLQITNESSIKSSWTYMVVQTGNNENGKVYTAIPLINSKLTESEHYEDIRNTIYHAINIYYKINANKGLNQDEENVYKQLLKNDVDLQSAEGLTEYLNNFIFVYYNQGRDLKDEVKRFDNPLEKVLFSIDSQQIQYIRNGNRGYINPKNTSQEEFNQTINYIIDKVLPDMYANISKSGVQNMNNPVKIIDVQEGKLGIRTLYDSYKEYLRDVTKTDILGKKVDTVNEQDVYTYTIHPKIELNVDDNVKPVEPETTPPIDKTKKEKVSKTTEEGYFQSKKDAFFDNDSNKIDNFFLESGQEYTDELPEITVESPEDIADKFSELPQSIILPNLDAEKQGAIVDILFKEALSEVISAEDKISTTDVYNKIFDQITSSLEIRADNIKGQQQNIKLAKSKKDDVAVERFQKQLAYEKYLFDLYQNFILNKSSLIELANNKLQTVDLITRVDNNDNEYISDNEDDVNEKIHDQTHYESDRKDKVSKRIKRFLADIREYDQKGNVKKNFLNRDSLMNFDEVYNQLQVITANVAPDYKQIMARLESYKDSFPFINDVINKLKDNTYPNIENIRNEFVLMMTNHYSNSKYVLYRKVSGGVDYVVDNSNANSIRDAIINNWESLFIKSNLIDVDPDNGSYIISKEKADNLIEKLEGWKKNPPKEATKEVRQWLRDVGIVMDDKTLKYLEDNIFRYNGNKWKWEDQFTKGFFEQISKGYLHKEKGQQLDQNSIVKQGIVKALAGLDSKFTTSFHSNSHREGNKTVYSYGVNKYITDKVREYKTLNESKDSDGNEVYTNTLVTKKLSVAFNKNSLWLSNMIKKDDNGNLMKAQNGEYIIDLETSTYQNLNYFTASLEPFKQMGAASRDNKELTKLSNAEIEAFKIANLHSSIKDNAGHDKRIINLLYLTTSDKSTVTGLTTEAVNIKFDHETANIEQETVDLLYEQLVRPEINRIRRVEQIIEDNKKDDINLGDSYLEGAKQFLLLPALNDVEGIFNEDGKLHGETETQLRSEIDSVIKNYINELVQEKLDSWEDNNIISKNSDGIYTSNYLNKKFVNSFKVDKNQKVKATATDMVIQYLVGNANMFMTTVGDPALFFKKDIKTTFENVTKRLAADIAPGSQGDQTMTDVYKQGFAIDRKVKSLVQSQLQKLLGKEAYNEIEATDAQEYTTFLEDLFVKNMQGKIEMDGLYSKVRDIVSNQIKQGNFDYIQSLEDNLSEKEFEYLQNLILQPMKPVYVENIIDEDLGIERRLYIKSSSFALSPMLTKGTELEKLRIKMEKAGISRLAYSTAVKNGNVTNPINLFKYEDKDGNLITNEEYQNLSSKEKENFTQSPYIDETVEFDDTNTLSIPRTGFRIQQDIPYNPLKDSINKVSQASKNLFVNMLEIDGFKVDWLNNGKEVKGSELQKEYLKFYQRLFEIQREELLEELNYNENEDTLDLNKLRDILKTEAIKRGYPLTDLQNFDLDNELKFLAFSPSAKKFEALLNSIVTNRVIKMKFPGKSYVLGSEEGFNMKNALIAEETDLTKHNIIPTEKFDGELKPSDGQGSSNQIIIPWDFKEDIEDFIIDGKIDLDKIPSKLLKMFGMRIPNQGPNSQAGLEVVGFLPKSTGDLIIAPRDFVEQMGSDFDVDKLYVYRYNTFYDSKSGKLKLYGADRKKAEGLYEKRRDPATEKLLADMLPEENVEEIFNWDKEKFIKKLEKADLINKIVDTHLAIHENPNPFVQRQIKKPLDFWKLDTISKKIAKIREKEGLFTGLSDEYQKKQFINAVSGKAGVGVFSNDSMFNALVQGKNIKFADRKVGKKVIHFEVKFGNNTSTGDLSNPFTLKSQKILEKVDYNFDKLSEEDFNKIELKSDIISGYQSAAVDNQNEQILDKINANSETFPVIKVMGALGFDEEIPYFLSQDILVDYVNEITKLRGLGEYIANVEQVARENILKNPKYQVEFDPKKHSSYGNEKLSLSVMQNMIKDANSVEDYKLYQRAILDKYMDLKIKGRIIGKIQSGLNLDSQGIGKSLFDSIIRQEEIETLRVDIENIDRLFEETIPAMAIQNGLKINNKLWKRFFPFEHPILTSNFQKLEKIYQRTDSNRMTRVEFREKVWNDMKRFLFSNPNLFSTKEIVNSEDVLNERRRLLIDSKDNKSLASITEIAQKNLKDNRFLQTLHTFIHKNGGPSTVTFRASTKEWRDESKIYEGIVDLLLNERNLGENNTPLEVYGKDNYTSRDLFHDLVWAAYLNGGIQEATQYVKYIPPAYLHLLPFAQKINDWVTRNLENDSKFMSGDSEYTEDLSVFTKQFIQNNPERLPKFESKDVEEYEDGLIYKGDMKTKEDVAIPFMSTYVKDTPRGFKNFKAYQLIGTVEKDNKIYPFYIEIPVVGTAGKYKISEYNYLSSSFNETAFNPQKTVHKEGALHMGNVVKKAEKRYKATNQAAAVSINELEIEDTYKSKKSARDVMNNTLNKIKNNSKDPFNQAVASALSSIINKIDLDNLDIRVADDLKSRFSKQAKGKYEKFSSGKRRLSINANHNDHKDISNLEHTLLHELIHAITSDVLKNPKTAEQKKLVKRLDSLRKEFQNYLNSSNEHKEKYAEYKKRGSLKSEEDLLYYGAENLADFVSLSFSNNMMQRVQNDIVSKEKTIFERFIEEIINILNQFGINIKKDSLLESSLESIVKLAEMQHESKTIATETKTEQDSEKSTIDIFKEYQEAMKQDGDTFEELLPGFIPQPRDLLEKFNELNEDGTSKKLAVSDENYKKMLTRAQKINKSQPYYKAEITKALGEEVSSRSGREYYKITLKERAELRDINYMRENIPDNYIEEVMKRCK